MRICFKNLNIISETGTITNVPVLAIKKQLLPKNYKLNIIFINKQKALYLNKTYRKKDYIPNILTFPLDKNTGEIYICRSIAKAQHKDFNLSYKEYLILLIIHGILHLKGFKHNSKMEELEYALTKKFSKQNKNR